MILETFKNDFIAEARRAGVSDRDLVALEMGFQEGTLAVVIALQTAYDSSKSDLYLTLGGMYWEARKITNGDTELIGTFDFSALDGFEPKTGQAGASNAVHLFEEPTWEYVGAKVAALTEGGVLIIGFLYDRREGDGSISFYVSEELENPNMIGRILNIVKVCPLSRWEMAVNQNIKIDGDANSDQ